MIYIRKSGSAAASHISKLFLSFLFATLMLNCSAQQSQKREVGQFKKIQGSGSVKIFFTQSDTSEVTVTAGNSEIDQISTAVESDILIISNKGNFSGPIEVHVKNKELEAVELSGASTFKSINSLKTDSFYLSLAGSARVKLQIEAGSIRCVQAGASSSALHGNAAKLDVNISGASSLRAFNLDTKKATVLATGAANARVFATESVSANAGGASDIKIKGNPTDITTETSAAANVTRVKEGEGSRRGRDTTTYNYKRKKIIVVDKDGEHRKETKKHRTSGTTKHWHGISLGTNGYLNPAGTLNMNNQYSYMELNYGRSLNLQVNPFEHDFRIVRNYVRLVTGLGFDLHWYQFANNTNLNADSSFTWGDIDSSNVFAYKKNSLRTIYIQVPLLLEFNTSRTNRRNVHLAVGVIGQYLIGSRAKQELERDKYEITQLRKDTYNLSPFAAKAHVNLGYRNFTVYAEYSLTRLFQAGRGPELYPFAAGIRIIPFS